MYILTRAEPLENCNDNICRVHDAVVEKQYLDAGYRKYERNYQLKSHHKEYIVSCPEFRKSGGGTDPVVAIPEFLVPGRPYPVYVYMYAISLYASMPEKGQRWAAEETRKRFGLESFAHTTLGRALKSLVRLLGGEAEIRGSATDAATPDAEGKVVFPRVHSTEALRKRAALFLSSMPHLERRAQFVIVILKLASELFKAYGRFLL